MKRETCEYCGGAVGVFQYMKNGAPCPSSVHIPPAGTMELLDAKEAKPKEVPGFTDEFGQFWEFVETSKGWVMVCFNEDGSAECISQNIRNDWTDALRAWLKETGRS